MKDIFYESQKDTSGIIYAEKQLPYAGRLHFHRAFELAYITKGKSGQYIVEDETFCAEENQIVFLHCWYRHTSSAIFEHEKYVIAVPENITKDIAALFKAQTLPTLLTDTEFNKTLLPYFEKLVYEGKEMPKILAKGYANIIFGSLFSHYDSVRIKPKHKSVSTIEQILNYIDEHYKEPITLETLACHFGYNKTYFSRLFNKNIGTSLSNYINMVRYDHFEKQYTGESTQNITNIIFDCGFPSLSTFYRVQKLRQSKK